MLRVRRADALGRFEFAPFYRELPKEFKPNTTAAIVQGDRPVNPELLRAMAKALDLPGPDYFLEYRFWRVVHIMEHRPELVSRAYDLLESAYTLLEGDETTEEKHPS